MHIFERKKVNGDHKAFELYTELQYVGMICYFCFIIFTIHNCFSDCYITYCQNNYCRV